MADRPSQPVPRQQDVEAVARAIYDEQERASAMEFSWSPRSWIEAPEPLQEHYFGLAQAALAAVRAPAGDDEQHPDVTLWKRRLVDEAARLRALLAEARANMPTPEEAETLLRLVNAWAKRTLALVGDGLLTGDVGVAEEAEAAAEQVAALRTKLAALSASTGDREERRPPNVLDPSLLAHPELRGKPLNAVYGEPPATVEGWRALSPEEQQEWIDSGWHPPGRPGGGAVTVPDRQAEIEAVARALARRNLYAEPVDVAEATWDAWAEFAADAIGALDALRSEGPEGDVEALVELVARHLVGPANPPMGDQEVGWEDVPAAEHDRLRRVARNLLEVVLPAALSRVPAGGEEHGG